MRKTQSGNLKVSRYLAISTSAIALGVALSATSAIAQEKTNAETVVVTGIRGSLQNAIAAKKKNSSIVESVSAEDIGKLPDNSIAESIARLPGIAAQRVNGRAQTLSIRGLGPDYTVTTLNGREQASTNDNRSVEFDQYPGELINQVLVYKTPNASMPVQGIAGTADLRTIRPLSHGKRTFALGYKAEKNSKDAIVGGTENTGERFTATYIDQFMDGKVGVALGYAKSKSPTQNNRWEAWGYTNNFYNTGNSIADGVKPIAASSLLDRSGLMGVLELKPNDQMHVTIDAYHSDFNETIRNQRIEFPLFNPANNGGTVGGAPGWDGSTVLKSYTAANGVVNSATYTGVKAVVGNYVTERDAKVDSIGLNFEYDTKAGWNLFFDASYSKVEREDVILETTAGTGPNGSGALDTITINQSNQTGATITNTIDYSNYNNLVLTDPRGWGSGAVSALGGQAGYLKNPNINDELHTIKFGAKKEVHNPIFKSFTVGLNQTERSKSKIGTEGFLSIATGATSAAVPTAYRRGVTDLSFIGMSKGIIAYDALGLYKDGFYRFTANDYPDAVKSSWAIKESILSMYAMADIDTTLFGHQLTGNIGLQAQMADQEATSQYSTSGGFNPKNVTDGANYTDVLPSANFTLSLPNDVLVRFAAAKTISRPRMDEMQTGSTFSYYANGNGKVFTNDSGQKQTLYWEGNGGNAGVEPWRANAFDLSVEKYFGRKGYVSAAVFYKDITSFIYTRGEFRDFSGYAMNPADAALSTFSGALSNRLGLYTTKANGKGGFIKGVELSASVPFEIFLPVLDGFGATASASFNKSEIRPQNFAIDVPGLSKSVVNATVYYEKHGFSARVSQRYRGDFLGEVPNYNNALDLNWVHSERIVDAQIGYSFQSGPLNGLSLNLSGQNLTDEPFYTYQSKGKPEQVLRYEKYGKTYTLNVLYKF